MSSTKRRGLAQGRGLDALLGSIRQTQAELRSAQTLGDSTLENVPLDDLQSGVYQPRREMAADALSDLAESIRKHGVMQPIVVRPLESAPGKYEIIAGERRWRAARQAGLATIPAIIRNMPNEMAIALALIENIQRENLSPMEEALALQRFHDEFGMTQQEIADTVGKARATVANLMRLVNLDDEVKTLLSRGELDMGHARAILSLPAGQQAEIARRAVDRGMSVRQVEILIRDLLNPTPAKQTPTQTIGTSLAESRELASRLSDLLNLKVEVDQHPTRGRGKLVIRYSEVAQLEKLLKQLGYQPS